VLAREQEIQQCGERELFSRFGRGRQGLSVEQGTRELRLIIERHACPGHAGAVRADPSREREVEQGDAVVAIDQDVPRMDVAVHDAALVQPGVDVEHGNRESEQRRAPLIGGQRPVFRGNYIDGRTRAPIQDEIRRLADRPAPPQSWPDCTIELVQHGRLVIKPLCEVGLRGTTRRFERIPSERVVSDLIHLRVSECVHGSHDLPVIHA